MEPSHFYAMLSRMKYINRWGLMNNTQYENISEHSQQVAILAHCLVLIHNKRFGGCLDAERAALLAVFHDATEIITGDMPTPIKYANPAIRDVYKQVEDKAADRLQAAGAARRGLPRGIQRHSQAAVRTRPRAVGLCQGSRPLFRADQVHGGNAHGQRRVPHGARDHRALPARHAPARGRGVLCGISPLLQPRAR